MRTRTSRKVSAVTFEASLVCRNDECQFKCKLLAEFVAEYRPAMFRNPAVVLPVIPGRGMDKQQ